MAACCSPSNSQKFVCGSQTRNIRTTAIPDAHAHSSSQNLQEITEDGIAAQKDRDPPGQNCSYIPPGDHRSEVYRLATFAGFPKEFTVLPTDMAAAGFYWTGYKDRVKCFSCGITVENWCLGDDGMDNKWHKSTCNMMVGYASQNIPIGDPTFRSLFRLYRANPNSPIINKYAAQRHADISEVMQRVNINESRELLPNIAFANIVDREHEMMLRAANLRDEHERRKTFDKWPSYPAPYLIGELAKQGFFYLGNLDRTQCFCCSGVLRNWAPNDDVSEQHKTHFGNCRFAKGEYAGNMPMSDSERAKLDEEYRRKIESLTTNRGEPPDPSPEEQRQLMERFPCRNPMNPHMAPLQQRIPTFDSRWPRQRIRAPVEQIAKSGMFFLGESDKTKCFYCNGGLQNWDRDDEPWTEHAKWFPGCEFVLRMKGVDFVLRLRDAHPNLNRPSIRNAISLDVPPNEIRRNARNPPAERINMTELENMGFTRSQIQRAISRRGNTRFNTEDIVQDLLEPEDEMPIESPTPTLRQPTSMYQQAISANAGQKREGTPANSVTVKKTRTSSISESASGVEIADSLREMEEAVLCKQCKKNKSEITLIPCGHLCLCEGCAANATRCIICKGRITEKIKVYRA